MNVDLTDHYVLVVDTLKRLRAECSKEAYPEVVILNVFHGKHVIANMWDDIMASFKKKLFGGYKAQWDSYYYGYQQLTNIHKASRKQVVNQQLTERIVQNKHERISNMAFADFEHNLHNAGLGSEDDIEEIEIAFIHYYLNNQLILLWSAFGGTGLSQIEALERLSGYVIEKKKLNDYATVEAALAQLCTQPFLEEHYSKLPPL